MKKLAYLPAPIRNKVTIAPIMGAGCLLIGVCMQIYSSDWILLIMSAILCLFFISKGIHYYRLGCSGDYITLTATCIGSSHMHLRKRNYTLKDAQGHTITLHLSQRLYKDQCYRLYFTKQTPFHELWGQPDFFVSRLLAAHLIGLEQDKTIY